MTFNRFQGTDTYLVTPELRDAVNVAIALEKPLLIRGEPGTGKTVLSEAVAESLEMELITWNIKSTSKAPPARDQLRLDQPGDARTLGRPIDSAHPPRIPHVRAVD